MWQFGLVQFALEKHGLHSWLGADHACSSSTSVLLYTYAPLQELCSE
jgi:hypothetical protein